MTIFNMVGGGSGGGGYDGPYDIYEDDYSAMQGPCPQGFHVPSKDEWVSLYNAGVSLGVWSSSSGTPINNYLKMPFAGYRNFSTGNVGNQGSNAYYRSSINDSAARSYFTSAAAANLRADNLNYKSAGLSIRPFNDDAVIPDGSWTTLYQGTGSAGIFRNSSLGLISISSDGTTWITIADKNLGATTVYNYGNTLSQNNCGYYYQRGNNYGFPRTGTVTTSSTQVDTTGYGPGNYYSSSTFINIGRDNWSSSNNNNLRGGETGVQQILVGEYVVINGVTYTHLQ